MDDIKGENAGNTVLDDVVDSGRFKELLQSPAGQDLLKQSSELLMKDIFGPSRMSLLVKVKRLPDPDR